MDKETIQVAVEKVEWWLDEMRGVVRDGLEPGYDIHDWFADMFGSTPIGGYGELSTEAIYFALEQIDLFWDLLDELSEKYDTDLRSFWAEGERESRASLGPDLDSVLTMADEIVDGYYGQGAK